MAGPQVGTQTAVSLEQSEDLPRSLGLRSGVSPDQEVGVKPLATCRAPVTRSASEEAGPAFGMCLVLAVLAEQDAQPVQSRDYPDREGHKRGYHDQSDREVDPVKDLLPLVRFIVGHHELVLPERPALYPKAVGR